MIQSGYLHMENILDTVFHYLRTFAWLDVLDILITAFLIYQVLKLVRGTSVESVIKGIVILIAVYMDFVKSKKLQKGK